MTQNIKPGNIIVFKMWDYKVVKLFGDILHVRPCKSNGRVRMHSPTISLTYKDGELTLFGNPFNKQP